MCVQDAPEHLKHAESKEEGYGIIQTMLATLGAQSSQYNTGTQPTLRGIGTADKRQFCAPAQLALPSAAVPRKAPGNDISMPCFAHTIDAHMLNTLSTCFINMAWLREAHLGAGDPFTRILMPSQSQVFQADTTGQLVHIGMQAQKAETEAGPFVRVSFVLTGGLLQPTILVPDQHKQQQRPARREV